MKKLFGIISCIGAIHALPAVIPYYAAVPSAAAYRATGPVVTAAIPHAVSPYWYGYPYAAWSSVIPALSVQPSATISQKPALSEFEIKSDQALSQQSAELEKMWTSDCKSCPSSAPVPPILTPTAAQIPPYPVYYYQPNAGYQMY